jgi:hypothetical protein
MLGSIGRLGGTSGTGHADLIRATVLAICQFSEEFQTYAAEYDLFTIICSLQPHLRDRNNQHCDEPLGHLDAKRHSQM